ncbi:hypothetical protein [Enterococcus timonensis]|uniref:hypothetical protein n=1 Tax=Enterococcus timonensis TaxID=1852364 RepID=UPI0008DA25C7
MKKLRNYLLMATALLVLGTNLAGCTAGTGKEAQANTKTSEVISDKQSSASSSVEKSTADSSNGTETSSTTAEIVETPASVATTNNETLAQMEFSGTQTIEINNNVPTF